MRYDDMMGLDMYDDGMEGFMSVEMLKEQVIAAGAGAGAVLLATWLTPKLPTPEAWSAVNKSRLRAGVATVVGMLLSRGLWDYNRDAAMAVLGAVSGLGVAQLVDSFFEINLLGGTPLGALPYDSELSYDNDAMSALAALETTGVTTAPGAFSDPTVTPEALMGTVVQAETLGTYNPYMA